MAASFECIRVLPLCWLFFIAFLALTAPGVDTLKFLKPAPLVLQSYLGMNTDIDCSTDNPNATVTLLHTANFMTWVEKPLSPNKLILNGQVFKLLSLTINDGGKYNCKATDGNQTIRWPESQGIMVINQGALPKYFTLIPAKPIVVLEGGNVQITCEAEGTKVSKLHWEKKTDSGYVDVQDSMVTDETDTDNNLVRAILKITNAQQDDEADYKCVVMAHNKQDSRLINVRVDAPTAPTFLNIFKPTPVKEGAEKVIKCDVKASPKPTVHWYKNGEMLNITNCTGPSDESCKDLIYEVYDVRDSALHTTITEQVLKIRSALYPRDQGEFVCRATNGVGPPAELAFDLDVQTGPILNKPSEPVAEYKGTSTNVSCSVAKSNPLPTFTWEYQDQNDQWEPVPENLIIPSTNTSTDHSVVLVDKDQPGTQYRCKAVNILGNDTHQVELVRQEKQKMIEFDPNSETQLDERSTLGLTCFNRCGAFCPAFFTKDGKKLSHKNDARVNVTMQSVDLQLQTVVLTIKNLTLNDSGSYRCVSSLDPNEYDTLNVTIIELVAPKIAVLPKTRNVVHGKDMWQTQLDCSVTGHPKPTITWFLYKDGERIQLNKNGNDLQGSGDNCKSRTDHYYFLRRDEPEHFVICNPDKENSGEYQCHASNSEGKATQSAFVNVLKKPEIKEPQDGYETPVMDVGHKLNVSCTADGNPLPNVTWVKNSTGEIIGTRKGSMQLVKTLEEDDFGSYKCFARNYLGRQEVSIKVANVGPTLGRQEDPPLSTGALVGIAIGVGLVVLIVLVICIVVYRRQKKQIDEYKEIYFLRQSDYQIDPDRSLLEQCNDLPYDPDWEFPEERLILGDVLGAGAFGQVVKAEAIGILALDPRDKTAESFKRRSKIRRSSRAKDLKKEDIGGGWKNTRIPVAVKTLKEGATEAEYKDLASELKILIHLGQHKNIINLLGACTRGKRLMVIMEFAPYGSLLSFLRGKRDIYEPDWTKTMNNPEKEFTLVDLVMIGYQVSRGMAFLASKKCVHRDLAARNILVGDDYVMKIADFGLARDIYKDDLYVKKTQGLLPVKWMAPESLFDRVYTEKTDVWSFGILLWETFTLGGSPYPGLPTEQLLDYLSEGKRMDMPAKCPLEVYTIMRDCWIHEPDQRPPFTILNEHLGKILERNLKKENPYLALTMDDEEGTDSQGYYLQPCDSGIRDSKRYVESPVHSPTSEEGTRCDSPLPALPPGQPIISDDDIQNAPLPPLPPPCDDVMSDEDEDPKPRTSAAGESGIDVDGGEYLDNGGEYIDDARDDSPFLPHHGDKLVAIDMDGPVDKVPKASVLNKGQKGRIETQL